MLALHEKSWSKTKNLESKMWFSFDFTYYVPYIALSTFSSFCDSYIVRSFSHPHDVNKWVDKREVLFLNLNWRWKWKWLPQCDVRSIRFTEFSISQLGYDFWRIFHIHHNNITFFLSPRERKQFERLVEISFNLHAHVIF